MPSNKTEYSKEYMRKYIKESPSIECEACHGHYKRYSKYVHDKSKRHLNAVAGNLQTNEMSKLLDRVKNLESLLNNKDT